jgi:transposase InsO family protein
MAVPHYAYLTLKIPGPKGTITVQGSFKEANTCDREFNRMAQTFGMTAEYERLKGETGHNVLPDVGRSLPDQAFDTTQDSTAAINFIKSIVFRFGVPYSIITDNGTNFTSKEFKSYCEGLGIKLKFASVAHPKTNGHVEKANGLICSGIKKRLLGHVQWECLERVLTKINQAFC